MIPLHCISFEMLRRLFNKNVHLSHRLLWTVSSIVDSNVSSDEGTSCSSDRILCVTHMSPTGEKQQWALYLCYHACIPDYSLRGQSHNEHLYRQKGWMTGPHRLIMQVCNYWTRRQILKGNLGIKCLTEHLCRNVPLPKAFQQKWQLKHMH